MKKLLSPLAVLVVLASLIALPVVHAESKFAPQTTPGQLPKDVRPAEYDITLLPNLKTQTFKGAEQINILVQTPSRTLVLNTLDITIIKAELERGQKAISIVYDPTKQITTITFAQAVSTGLRQLALEFEGKINSQGQGLHTVNYQTDNGAKTMLATQMEPTDARRMFPCWDEPVYRAAYRLAVVVPSAWNAFSNMPIETSTELLDRITQKPIGYKKVSFARSPKMSSYLVALVAGELETLDGQAGDTKIRIVTPLGKKSQGRYALESAEKLLTYYNTYFKFKYPLPKLDLIAVPGGFSGAMENWGAITFNESILLFDPAKSSQRTKEDVFKVVAHEMAHQWFGDLVTMAWWDNLWLNEGFASWMETKATDYFNPQWQVWLRANQEKDDAMATDAQRTTHPIQQPILNESQASDAFDEITYLKGQSFIRMLETYLGESTFRDGLRRYMVTHQYSSSTTADLWEVLTQYSNQPVAKVAQSWTEQPGFPLVQVSSSCVASEQILKLGQQRFALDTTTPSSTLWAIPLTWTNLATKGVRSSMLMDTATGTAKAGDCQGAVKLNAGNVGYYRVQYSPEMLVALQKSLPDFPASDRVNVLSDTWALVQAGRTPLPAYLDLVKGVQGDNNLAVWSQITDTLFTLDQLQRDQPGREAFRAYARSLLLVPFRSVGWDAKPGEDPTIGLLRTRLLSTRASLGDQTVLAEARKRFSGFLSNTAALAPDLRPVVITEVGRYADQTTYDKLHELGRKSTSTEERDLLYGALAAALDPKLAQQTLRLSLTDELSPNQAIRLVQRVTFQQPVLGWNFAQENMKALAAKLTFFRRNSFVPGLLSSFSDNAHATELENYARTNLSQDAHEEVAKAAESIRLKASIKVRELPRLAQWLQTQSVK